MIPLVASAPHDRLLTHVGIAWWMLFAHLVVALARASSTRVVGAVLRVAAGALVIVHAILAPLALAIGINTHEDGLEIEARALDEQSDWWKREVIAINVPTMFALMQLNWQRARSNLPGVQWLTALGATDQDVEVTRVDESTLELFSTKGYLLDVFSNFWRGPAVPLRPNEITVVHDYSATVLAVTQDGRPQRVRIRFARSLDDPGFYFIQWVDKQLKPFPVAAPGDRRVIRAAPFEASSPGAGTR
jgi:hypothetical protein